MEVTLLFLNLILTPPQGRDFSDFMLGDFGDFSVI